MQGCKEHGKARPDECSRPFDSHDRSDLFLVAHILYKWEVKRIFLKSNEFSFFKNDYLRKKRLFNFNS